MGCPLKFSTSSGAGSALLKKPETVKDILTTLRRNLPTDVHVTCKIRLLDTIEETVNLARVIESCGVSAFGVHGRYVDQRPRQPAHWDMIKQVVDAVSCPVIANGDVFEYSDFERIREQTGAASAMCGRGAMWNQSIFRKNGLLSPRENLNKLMTKCLEWSHSMKNTKYLARYAKERTARIDWRSIYPGLHRYRQLIALKDSNNRYPSHSLRREILIKSSGLENDEGRALNKSKSLAEVARTFKLAEDIIGRNRKTHLKRNFEETEEE